MLDLIEPLIEKRGIEFVHSMAASLKNNAKNSSIASKLTPNVGCS